MDVQSPESPRRISLRLDVYPLPQVLQIVISSLPSLWSEALQTAGSLGSTAVTPLRRYYEPNRHPLAFDRFPGVTGYTIYLAPPISRWDEEGFSSCLACPCHRAVAFHPAEVK
jgi:hypothetical protein